MKSHPKQSPEPATLSPYNELGRRILAALVSTQLRLSSVDYTLKKHIPAVVNPCWAIIGRDLLEAMGNSLSEKIEELSKGSLKRPS